MIAPRGWRAPTLASIYEWLDEQTDMTFEVHTSFMAMFVVVPLLADSGELDAAYTTEQVLRAGVAEILAQRASFLT